MSGRLLLINDIKKTGISVKDIPVAQVLIGFVFRWTLLSLQIFDKPPQVFVIISYHLIETAAVRQNQTAFAQF